MEKIRFAVLGCGNMAQAILHAVAHSSAFAANGWEIECAVADPDPEKLRVAGQGVHTYTENAQAILGADYVLLAVKPQSAAAACSELDFKGKTLLSIMAGVDIAALRALTGCERIVRIMPNLNAKVGQSFNAYASVGLSAAQTRFVETLLASFGSVRQVEERQLNAVTGLTGSSPAFVFMLIRAFMQAGLKYGFDEDTAKEMALTAIGGSVESVRQSQKTLDSMIDAVCSKGGTTIEGVSYLTENGFEALAIEAIDRAVKKAEKLSRV